MPSHALRGLIYGIDDRPPLLLSIGLGVQNYLTMFGATISIPFILATRPGALGIDPSTEQGGVDLGLLINTIFFMSGWSTLLQATFGNRLPLVQGGTFSFLAPTLSIMAHPDVAAMDWRGKITVIQGAVIVGAIIEFLLGISGLIGFLPMILTPVVVAPVVALVGLALFSAAVGIIGNAFHLTLITILLIIVFSQLLPAWRSARVLQMFPIAVAIVLAWALAAIVTAAGGYGDDDAGRTSLAAAEAAAWFRWPYPFQWGAPKFFGFAIVSMFAGYVASIAESIGDYYACARLSGAPVPNAKTLSMGIAFEGLGCLLDGIVGTGNGTTSYSENIGAISITRVGSRFVVQCGALFMIVLGCFAKFGAFFASIPLPIVAGVWITLFGMIASVGLSNLQYVNLNAPRNLFVIGFSLFFGLFLPSFVAVNPITIDGAQGLADIFQVLFSTSMAVALIVGLILDNLIPGTAKDRGKLAWRVTAPGEHDYSHYQFLRDEFLRPAYFKAALSDFIKKVDEPRDPNATEEDEETGAAAARGTEMSSSRSRRRHRRRVSSKNLRKTF